MKQNIEIELEWPEDERHAREFADMLNREIEE